VVSLPLDMPGVPSQNPAVIDPPAETRVFGRSVLAVLGGDITWVAADAIVNAANRFHATVDLSDPRRPVPQFSEIAQHVIGPLAGVTDASLKIRIEIEAEHKGDGFPEQVERTVSENARTLKFKDFGFEED
jgi:hypothetical protein